MIHLLIVSNIRRGIDSKAGQCLLAAALFILALSMAAGVCRCIDLTKIINGGLSIIFVERGVLRSTCTKSVKTLKELNFFVAESTKKTMSCLALAALPLDVTRTQTRGSSFRSGGGVKRFGAREGVPNAKSLEFLSFSLFRGTMCNLRGCVSERTTVVWVMRARGGFRGIHSTGAMIMLFACSATCANAAFVLWK